MQLSWKTEKTTAKCIVSTWLKNKKDEKSSDVITIKTLYQKNLNQTTHAIPLQSLPTSSFALCDTMSS